MPFERHSFKLLLNGGPELVFVLGKQRFETRTAIEPVPTLLQRASHRAVRYEGCPLLLPTDRFEYVAIFFPKVGLAVMTAEYCVGGLGE